MARVFKGDMEQFGDASEFPHAATSYRLTEHFHFWTKHVQTNAVLQPEFFRRDLGAAGQGEGHQLRRLGRGLVQARLGQGQGGGDQAHQAAQCDGKTVHIVGIPLHWGFTGAAKGFGRTR